MQFLDAANLMTLFGLASGVTCVLLAMSGALAWAAVALVVAGLCDLFDGLLARRLSRTDLQKQFGARLDSLVDPCAFGMAPVVLMSCAGLTSIGEAILLIVFAGCVVWRVAWFDTVGLTQTADRNYYRGLPCTYVALAIPAVFLAGLIDRGWLRGCLIVVAVLLAPAMVSPIRIRKPGGVAYAVFLLLAMSASGSLIWFADRL